MASQLDRQAMYELGARHAALEARADLEGVMATMVAEPTYELLPAGLRMTGASMVRRYYETCSATSSLVLATYELIGEWCDENAVVQEYRIDLEIDGQHESHRVVGILFAEGTLLGGERVYASERCLPLDGRRSLRRAPKQSPEELRAEHGAVTLLPEDLQLALSDAPTAGGAHDLIEVDPPDHVVFAARHTRLGVLCVQ